MVQPVGSLPNLHSNLLSHALTLTHAFMKATHVLAFASIACLTMSFSCDKQEAQDLELCNGTTVPLQSQAFELPTGCFFTAQRGEAKTYILNSAAELSASTQCGSGALPTVDFTTYTLVAGQLPRPSGDVLRSQQVAQDCQGNYVYTLNVAAGVTLSPRDVPYSVLVPKLAAGKQVHLVVNTVQ
jgi:hypothetical protein